MRGRIISLSLLLALSACHPAAIIRPQEVDIAVREKCDHHLPPEPNWALTYTSPDSDIALQAKAVLVEISQRQAYENQLKAAVFECD